MQDFDHLLTTRPHDIRAVFISDLHLSQYTPALNTAFIQLSKSLVSLPSLNTLYILGDWLDGWIGDDDYLSLSDTQKKHHWLTPILDILKILNQKTKIYVMRGNRDFTIRQSLCNIFGGQIIVEPYYTEYYRLEHGDRLCTDDKNYQWYRRIIQNPIVSWLLLHQPLNKRRQLAQAIKQKSKKNKAQKPKDIMDVNEKAVNHALKNCKTLIHGHTHRPAIHHLGNKTRIVLGDWQANNSKVSAVIGVMVGERIELNLISIDTHSIK